MKEYFTDEELELFIRQMEQQELYAPKHMKEQILSQAFPKQTVEVLPKSGGGKEPHSFLAYRIKIIAGMAAAIVMLILLPIESDGWEFDRSMEREFRREWAQETEREGDVELNNLLNDGTQKVNQKINSWFNHLFNNGGIYYED